MVLIIRFALIACLFPTITLSAAEHTTASIEDDRLLPLVCFFTNNRRQLPSTPHTPEALKEQALVVAARNGQLKEMQTLLAAGVKANVPHCPNATLPLIVACRLNRLDMVTLLLEHHASPDATDNKENTALSVACWHKLTDIAIIETLLAHQATVDTMNQAGSTPIMYACQNGRRDIVKLLISSHPTNEPYMDHETRDAVTALLN